jgi:hypothetical protein
MPQLAWAKCGEGAVWCKLADVNLSHVSGKGVYVIWHGGNPGRTVCVGQGDIAAKVGSHKSNKAVLAHAKTGPLFVTWAIVPAAQMDGVERYLADQWHPLVAAARPNCAPIAVNSPW